MSAPAIITGLSQIAGQYDALLCDVWGVIHNGRESFPAACEALARFRSQVGPVILLSNAPRPSEAVKPQLRQLGVPDTAWSAYVTSGDATRRELEARAPGPVWAIGPARDAPLYEGIALDFSETPQEAAFVSCTGPFDDETDVPEDYRARFEVCVERAMVMVCANPDRVVHRGDQLIYCGGALAELYESMGGKVVMSGKPYAPVYGCGMEAVEAQLGRTVDRRRVLCIGDGVATDVLGANRQDLDCLFVGAGLAGDRVLDADGALIPGKLETVLKEAGVSAAHAIARLAW